MARLGPGLDHPQELAHPEGRYLKGLLLRVTDVLATPQMPSPGEHAPHVPRRRGAPRLRRGRER
jgi:hypothetical protein